MVAEKLNFRPRGRKWRRRFGVRVRFPAGRRFGACVRCEGGSSSILRAQSGRERGCGGLWGGLEIIVGWEQVCAERREMLTAHRIFIIAKSQPKARG